MFLAEQTVWVLTFQMNLTPKATIHSEIPFAHRAEVTYGYTLVGTLLVPCWYPVGALLRGGSGGEGGTEQGTKRVQTPPKQPP